MCGPMDNKNIRNDLILLTGSQLLYKLVGYVVLMVLTRYLTRDEMGQFFLAASLGTLTAMLVELGTHGYLTRQIAAKPGEGTRWFSEALSLSLPTLVIAFVALNLIVLVTKRELSGILLPTTIYILLERIYLTFGAAFVGYRRISLNVICGTVTKLLLVALVVVAVQQQLSIQWILWCHIAANACLLTLAYLLSRDLIGSIRLRLDLDAVRRILPVSITFFGVAILGLVHFSADTLMLGYMHSFVAVATYETAFKLLEASRFLIRPIYTIFLPVVTGLAARNEWDQTRRLCLRLFLATFGLGIALAVVVGLGAKWIIPAVFGADYNDSVPVLIVLYACVPVLFTTFVGVLFANATGNVRTSLRITATAVAVNIALNALIIPRWGAIGAAWTTVLSHTFLSLRLLWFNAHWLRTRAHAAHVV
jgi:O-antigen/teichoic acid export membrane protein